MWLFGILFQKCVHGQTADVQVRRRKQALFLFSTINVGVQIYNVFLQAHFIHYNGAAWTILRLVSEMVFASYTFILSAWYMSCRQVPCHRSLTSHICSCSMVALIHWYFATIGRSLATSYIPLEPHWTEYLLLIICGLICLVCAMIPTGPMLHQNMLGLYSQSVTQKLKESGYDPEHIDKPNVNGEVSSSILGRLIFAFIWPMMVKVSSMDQADVQDLPVAHAYFRTQHILHTSLSTKNEGGISSSWGPTKALLWAVWWPEREAVLKSRSWIEHTY